MGVVIGETTEIGDNCTHVPGRDARAARARIRGSVTRRWGTMCSSARGAKVLGPMKIGDNARIAAGAVVLEEVPGERDGGRGPGADCAD